MITIIQLASLDLKYLMLFCFLSDQINQPIQHGSIESNHKGWEIYESDRSGEKGGEEKRTEKE